ncbi:MAG: winged helix-turn-helix domain-containing protein [Tepidanaerobacteraceae bacterium]
MRANKNLELLKYFITFRNRKLVPESIVEDIWKEDECVNPHNALRTQIFRLRKNIKKWACKRTQQIITVLIWCSKMASIFLKQGKTVLLIWIYLRKRLKKQTH